MMSKRLSIFLTFFIAFSFSTLTLAKKKKNQRPVAPQATTEAGRRVELLSADDKRQFEALSDEQKQKINSGQIDNGFNAWMVKLALGKPFYDTEHSPIFTDYEEVWLYTRPDVIQDVNENRIIDPQTNWPTIHRTTSKKTCNVSDFYVLWDRGVVQGIHKVTEKQVHGSCTIQTSEAWLPIVNGKPVEPKKRI